MFGTVTPNLTHLTEKQKAEYKSHYCGLCHSLKDTHNNFCRLALTYDMTFLSILLSALNEPVQTLVNCNCLFHPGSKFKATKSDCSEFCANMTILFAYHKLADDINDDNSVIAKIGSKALKSNYKSVADKYPELCKNVESAMKKIFKLEQNPTPLTGDEISAIFGEILGQVFAEHAIFCKDYMYELGFSLGQFIYFMDAAIDIAQDSASNKFNPFLQTEHLKQYKPGDFATAKEYYEPIDKVIKVFKNARIYKTLRNYLQEILKNYAGKVMLSFEQIPLASSEEILQNILYEGMWASFNLKYKTPNNALK